VQYLWLTLRIQRDICAALAPTNYTYIFKLLFWEEELECEPEGDHEHDEEGEEESRGRGLDGP